jgi:hypothetical protein
LSAIFEIKSKQNKKKKKRSGKSSPLPTYQVSFKYLQPFLRNRCVTHGRTAARKHGSTRVKIISCHSFAWQLKYSDVLLQGLLKLLTAGQGNPILFDLSAPWMFYVLCSLGHE